MESRGAASQTSEAKDQPALKKWAPLIAVSLAIFVVVLDSTMMNVAVPTIAKDLKTEVGSVQAAISLYSMVMASPAAAQVVSRPPSGLATVLADRQGAG